MSSNCKCLQPPHGRSRYIGQHDREVSESYEEQKMVFPHLLPSLGPINCKCMAPIYRRCCKEKGEKKVIKLADFRTEVGLVLCKQGQPVTTPRGRPRNSDVEVEIQAKRLRGPAAAAPLKDVRLDQTSHWPQWGNDRQRCMMPDCPLKAYSYCGKCGVFLCDRKTQHCFTEYHNN